VDEYILIFHFGIFSIGIEPEGMKSIHTKEQASFIERLKKARNEAGLTQAEAAKKLKRGQPYISKVEAGELRVGVVELNQFAKLYGKAVGYFLK